MMVTEALRCIVTIDPTVAFCIVAILPEHFAVHLQVRRLNAHVAEPRIPRIGMVLLAPGTSICPRVVTGHEPAVVIS
jgi:hypothetical protein